MAKKIEITITDKDGDLATKFYSKQLTKLVNKLPPGTLLNVHFQENNFGKQFVGNYVTKSLPNQPDEPPTITCPDGQHLEGEKCVPDIIPEPDPHTCPTGEHWDDLEGKCVPDVVEPPICPDGQHLENGVCVPDVIVPPPTQEGLLWSSDRDGKWNDGNKREITIKQGGQQPDDKSIFVAASGSPKLVVDGDGVAHLVGGTGVFDNLSLKLRSRHQEGGPCENRFGGYGGSIDRSSIDMKTETCHNIHTNAANKNHGVAIKNGEWHHADFECTGDKPVKFKFSVDGSLKMEHQDNNPPAGSDKATCDKNSMFWIRGNNSDHPRIYVCARNYNARLSLDFMFENTNSIALRNVELVAI